MEHTDNAYDSLKHYFGVLEQTGAYNKQETMGLLMYCFLVDQVFNGPLSDYLDNEGLAAFNKALNCLYRSGCLVNNPSLLMVSEPRGYSQYDWFRTMRITDGSAPRITEEDDLRRTE